VGVNRGALRELLGFDSTFRIADGRRAAALREGLARVNPGAMWKILADRLYGSSVDAPAVATREALQNSRDAIDIAWRKGLIAQEAGSFEVLTGWENGGDGNRFFQWRDNGIGMSADVVFDKFLSLGDTTKTVGDSAGGFGIAKAIILGLSTTFRWKLHSLDSVYVANGFDQPVRQYPADFFHQGVDLTVFDVDRKYNRFWGEFGRSEALDDRIRTVLAGNNLAPKRNHAGVRLYYYGSEVKAALQGRGVVLVENLEVAAGVSIDMRAYKRADLKGLQYVRLAGLLQFTEGIHAQFDLTIDLHTRIAPSADGYPVTAARTALDGNTRWRVQELVSEATEEAMSATREETSTASFGLREGQDYEAVEAGLRTALARYDQMLGNARTTARLRLVDGTGGLLRRMEAERQATADRFATAQEQRRQQAEAARATPRPPREGDDTTWFESTPPTPARPEPPPRSRGGLSLASLRRIAVKAQTKRGGVTRNPFAGFAALHVNEAQFNSQRLRPYFSNPERWIDLALAWQMTCRLVLAETGKAHQAFDVGFVFDDEIRAMYAKKANERAVTLYLNPDWFAKSVIRAYKDRPLNVAAILHAKACHEIAHIEYGHHGESFSSHREALADETAAVLYPLVGVVEGLLGIRAAPTPEMLELERLRKKVTGRGQRAQTGDSELIRLRRRLVAGLR